MKLKKVSETGKPILAGTFHDDSRRKFNDFLLINATLAGLSNGVVTFFGIPTPVSSSLLP